MIARTSSGKVEITLDQLRRSVASVILQASQGAPETAETIHSMRALLADMTSALELAAAGVEEDAPRPRVEELPCPEAMCQVYDLFRVVEDLTLRVMRRGFRVDGQAGFVPTRGYPPSIRSPTPICRDPEKSDGD